MTVRMYRNTDAGAPVLLGNAPGGMINVLDKCLVAGYGAKTGAGWTKPYTGTNLAAFKQGAGSNGMYLRVDDTAVPANGRSARVRGFETMSDVNTGTGPFPTVAQLADPGMYWTNHINSTTAQTTARNWCIVADERFFYFFLSTYPAQDDTNYYYSECYYFGDIEAYGSTDLWATILGGGGSVGDVASTGPTAMWGLASAPNVTTSTRLYAARRYDGVGASDNVLGLTTDMGKMSSNTAYIGAGAFTFPHPVDNTYLMGPVELVDRTLNVTLRGKMPGLMCQYHPVSAAPARWDTFDGAGDLAGKSYVVWKQGASVAFIEYSDTWRT